MAVTTCGHSTEARCSIIRKHRKGMTHPGSWASAALGFTTYSLSFHTLHVVLAILLFPCCHAADLQTENTRLRQELLELRLAIEASGTGKGTAAARAAAAAAAGGSSRDGEEEEDALAAAERLLGGSSDAAGAAAVASPDWKVQEIGRLQDENRQLQAKVRM